MSLFDQDRSARLIPASLITGFLGSGKTTLLNHLLRDPAMARSLVIVNEFGEVGLDHYFIGSQDSDMVLMQSGCLCCTIKGDLEKTLRETAAKRQANAIPPFDRVLIETTGLADPTPILALLLNNPFVSHDYRLDAVITTVDCVHGARQLDRQPEPARQAAVADRLLLTKTDLASGEDRGTLARRLAGINPAARQFDVTNGRIDPGLLFDAGPFDPAGKTAQVREWLAAAAHQAAAHDDHGHAHHHPDVNRHDHSIGSFVLSAETPLDWDLFQGWLAALRHAFADRLLRVKGLLNVAGESQPLVIHGVHDTFHPPTLLAAWPDADRSSRLVLIGHDLPAAEIAQSWRRNFVERGDISERTTRGQ